MNTGEVPPTATPATVDDLDDAERAFMLREIADTHPETFKQLLGRVGEQRRRTAARTAMPPHPFTQHRDIQGLTFCYWVSDGATCLRAQGSTLHVTEGTR